MNNSLKQILKGVWSVVFSTIGLGLCLTGINGFIVPLSGYFVAHHEIQYFIFFVALIFIVPGLLILRICVRKKWYRSISISSALGSLIFIKFYFIASHYVVRKKTGIELEILMGTLNTYLILGIVLALASLMLIGYHIANSKKKKRKNHSDKASPPENRIKRTP